MRQDTKVRRHSRPFIAILIFGVLAMSGFGTAESTPRATKAYIASTTNESSATLAEADLAAKS